MRQVNQNKRYAEHHESFVNSEIPYLPMIRTMDFTRSAGNRSKVPHFRDSDRLIHFMSVNERWAFLNILHNCDVIDVYEQWAIDLESSMLICQKLDIEHPKIPRGSSWAYQSFDLLVELDASNDDTCVEDVKWLAVAVKSSYHASNKRVIEKLLIQEAFTRMKGYEFCLITDDEIRNVYSETLDTLYFHYKLRPSTEIYYDTWLNTFRGELLFNSDMRLGALIKAVASSVGIEDELSAHFFCHALWWKDLTMNWDQRLRYELSAKSLGVTSL